jgi:hypothetical protein
MGLKFNPLTSTFDLVGSGGGSAFFAGEVATYADLPLDGTAALNSRWLVRSSSGTWPFPNYRQGGIYIRTSIVGSFRDNDYTLADTKLPDVFADSAFLLYDNSDSTRNLQFDLGSITTGTTRTLTAPNASGRIQIEGQPIGNTTPAAGSFTTLTANNGTLTASAPVLDLAQTWNNAAVTFTGIRFNATNTASASVSPLIDLQVGGVSRMRMTRGGTLHLSEFTNSGFYSPAPIWHGSTAGLLAATNLAIGSSLDTILERGGAGIIEQRNAANAQEYRIFNTFTSATNHERGFLKWSSNVFQIGTEKGSGGGTARALEFQTDGVTRLTIATNGQVTAGTQINTPIIRSTGTWLDISDSSSGPRFGFFQHGGMLLRDSGYLGWNASGTITSSSTGDLRLFRDAAAALALRNDANAQTFRIYNTVSGTNNVNFDRVNFRWASNEFIIDAEAGGTGTLRGIKIGSATSSLLGFYGATPVDRPATVADPAGGGTVDTEARTAINDIIDRLQELGLIA